MTTTKKITGIIQSMIETIKNVLPFAVSVDKPSLLKAPYEQNDIGVLIAITGDMSGRVVIDGTETVYGKIAKTMFGIALEEELLQSFAGELGNMIVGNLSTILATNKIEMDITPPTILVGNTKLYGFDKALRLPISIKGIGSLTVIFMYE